MPSTSYSRQAGASTTPRSLHCPRVAIAARRFIIGIHLKFSECHPPEPPPPTVSAPEGHVKESQDARTVVVVLVEVLVTAGVVVARTPGCSHQGFFGTPAHVTG